MWAHVDQSMLQRGASPASAAKAAWSTVHRSYAPPKAGSSGKKWHRITRSKK